MTTAQTASNPFALMMNPEAVFEALSRSDRLGRLKSRVCRPLDKPLIAHADAEAEDQVETPKDELMTAVSRDAF
jgi:hypothetical protein